MEEYEEACALRSQGWSVSAIGRHLGRDRKTVRSYLSGQRIAGTRAPAHNEYLRYASYCQQRLNDDPHLQATVLHAEIVRLGYSGGYSTFTRAVRGHLIRPRCQLCQDDFGYSAVGGHPATEDVRFDWLELPAAPAHWHCGGRAHVLLASLTRSGRWRGTLTESRELPQFVEAMDQAMRCLGGTGRRWVFDRLPPVCSARSGRLTAAFTDVARYYGTTIAIRAKDELNDLDEAHRSLTQHWWRTVPDSIDAQAAQASLDQFAQRAEERTLQGHAPRLLLTLPPRPFPARICTRRTVTSQGLVNFRGNHYAVPADLAGAVVEVRQRLDELHLSITTTGGAVIARHHLAPRGADLTVAGPCLIATVERKARPIRPARRRCPAGASPRPYSREALAEAAALCGQDARQGVTALVTTAPEPATHHHANGATGPCPAPATRDTGGCDKRARHLTARHRRRETS
ncbi:Mu transposase domain-containing protein [Kitasatospora nipponensis]